MNKTELIAQASKLSGVSQKDTKAVLAAIMKVIQSEVADGKKVRLVDFGTFESRYRQGRTQFNPMKGEKVDVPGKHVPRFSPGRGFKRLVNGE